MIGMKMFLGRNLLLVPFGFDSKKWEKMFDVACISVLMLCVYKRFGVMCISIGLVGLNFRNLFF